ncbi:hypothetical protein EV182_006926, partial [Spiromyces aspiralis]
MSQSGPHTGVFQTGSAAASKPAASAPPAASVNGGNPQILSPVLMANGFNVAQGQVVAMPNSALRPTPANSYAMLANPALTMGVGLPQNPNFYALQQQLLLQNQLGMRVRPQMQLASQMPDPATAVSNPTAASAVTPRMSTGAADQQCPRVFRISYMGLR